ncbi:MAG TPA: biotin--[acetyl-CoA-carboxylase] ligase [Phycisphaerae bacterium]|nr:biotin--[acetyl-CoA-carboxylase] ligase [Phycisphaerae bacterium]
MTARGGSHELSAAELSRDLNVRRVGREITVLSEVDSTNEYAFEVLASTAGKHADGHVVFAEHQEGGRGRLGRSWHSPRGASLLFTTLLWEGRPPLSPSWVIMAAAVAVVRGIEQSTEVEPVIRWPNDIYVGDKKLAGILAESRAIKRGSRALALGVGVNCLQRAAHFPPEIRRAATSLDLESSRAVDRTAVARAILRNLDAYFAEPGRVGDDQLVAAWREHSADVGARVTLLSEGERFTGRIVDVHPADGLLVQLDTGARQHLDPATTTRM